MLSENRWAGQDTRNEAKQEVGYLLLNIYVHGRALYTAAHEVTTWYVQKRNAAVRNCGKTRNGAERNCQTLSDWCGWCWNVGIVLQVALDLRPNVAGIGTLHCICGAVCIYLDPANPPEVRLVIPASPFPSSNSMMTRSHCITLFLNSSTTTGNEYQHPLEHPLEYLKYLLEASQVLIGAIGSGWINLSLTQLVNSDVNIRVLPSIQRRKFLSQDTVQQVHSNGLPNEQKTPCLSP